MTVSFVTFQTSLSFFSDKVLHEMHEEIVSQYATSHVCAEILKHLEVLLIDELASRPKENDVGQD